jgi:Tfp pilus assembly protein PilF
MFPFGGGPAFCYGGCMRRFAITFAAAALAAVCAARGQEDRPDAGARFEYAFDALVRADEAFESGAPAVAGRHYRAALEEYERLLREYPNWDAGLTRFRIKHCRDRLRQLPVDAASASIGEPEAARQAARALQNALRQMARNDPAAARATLLEALRRDPDEPALRMLLGVATSLDGREDDAEQVLRQLVADRPADARPRVALAGVLLAQGELGAARRELETALAVDARSAEAHFNLAQVMLLDRRPAAEAVREHYEASVKLGGKPDAPMEEALQRLSRGSLPKRFGAMFRREKREDESLP